LNVIDGRDISSCRSQSRVQNDPSGGSLTRPLFRGKIRLLTGKIDDHEVQSTDIRNNVPRFSPEAGKADMVLVDPGQVVRKTQRRDASTNRAHLATGAEAMDRTDSRDHEIASAGRKSWRGER
jgi:hypothetical protein